MGYRDEKKACWLEDIEFLQLLSQRFPIFRDSWSNEFLASILSSMLFDLNASSPSLPTGLAAPDFFKTLDKGFQENYLEAQARLEFLANNQDLGLGSLPNDGYPCIQNLDH
jgi:hypothetical protein